MAPVLGAVGGPSGPVIGGQTVTFSGNFADTGTQDVHTVLIDWGDGFTTSATVTQGSGTGSYTGSHAYAATGNYTVTITLNDDDLGTNIKTASVTAWQSIFVLNPNAAGSLQVSGNGTINVSGHVVVNSTSTTALQASGNAILQATKFTVDGGIKKSGNAKVIGPVTDGSVADPLAGLVAPAAGTSLGAVSVSGNTIKTINPGTYTSIAVSGNGKLTMNPGVYIITGGGFTVSGNGCVTGNGVAIVNTKATSGSTTGSINISGNGNIRFTPMTTGSLAGIVFFQPSVNTKAMSLSGNGNLGISGTIYAPKAQVTISGNGTSTMTILADTLRISGNGGSSMVTSGTATDPSVSGAFLGGDVRSGVLWVSVDYGGSGLSDVAHARFLDAVATMNATFGVYGLELIPVDVATNSEDIRIHITDVTLEGGVAEGILGYATMNGDIYMVSGWTWFMGADVAGIGADMYDFQTVLTHELGHSIGLGHSDNAASVMYASLNSATAVRNFVTSDLPELVADDADHSEDHEDGEALHAAGPRRKASAGNGKHKASASVLGTEVAIDEHGSHAARKPTPEMLLARFTSKFAGFADRNEGAQRKMLKHLGGSAGFLADDLFGDGADDKVLL
jgi:hypothetical protein